MIRFNEIPIGSEFYELDHKDDEIRYRKTSHLGIAGMICNAVRLGPSETDETPCWVPFDKQVFIKGE